jgi:hypothetical protein
VAGAAFVQFAVARLAAHLWMDPGGPMRRRRLAVAFAHAFPPAALWGATVLVQGWAIRPLAVVTTLGVLAGTLLGAWAWTPASPLHPRPEVRWGTVLASAVFGVAVFALAAWAGAPARGHGTALVWGFPGRTNNVRPGMAVVRVMPLRAPRTPPAR